MVRLVLVFGSHCIDVIGPCFDTRSVPTLYPFLKVSPAEHGPIELPRHISYPSLHIKMLRRFEGPHDYTVCPFAGQSAALT